MVGERVPVSKAALRKLPTAAADGTPYCPAFRTYGELNLTVSAADSR